MSETSLFLSPPIVQVLPRTTGPWKDVEDQDYSIVRQAFGVDDMGRSTGPTARAGENGQRRAAGDIGAECVRRLLARRHVAPETVSALVDCRSSTPNEGPAPTYRLAAAAGLPRALCWSLSGQAGSELGEAVRQVADMLGSAGGSAVISTLQVVHPLDPRDPEGSLSLGDAAAAILAYRAPQPAEATDLRLIGSASAQRRPGESWQPALQSLVDQGACDLGGRSGPVAWRVVHRCNAALHMAACRLFPAAPLLERSRYADLNFGCADALSTLEEVLGTADSRGIGWILMAGRHGATEALLVETSSPGARHGAE